MLAVGRAAHCRSVWGVLSLVLSTTEMSEPSSPTNPRLNQQLSLFELLLLLREPGPKTDSARDNAWIWEHRFGLRKLKILRLDRHRDDLCAGALRKRARKRFSQNLQLAISPSPRIYDGSDPNGIRTRVTAVKGLCPGPLDDRVAKARAISELLLLDAREIGFLAGSFPYSYCCSE